MNYRRLIWIAIMALSLMIVTAPANAEEPHITTGNDILKYIEDSKKPDANGFHLGLSMGYIQAVRETMIADGFICTTNILDNIVAIRTVLSERRMPELNKMPAARVVKFILMANGCEMGSAKK